MALPISGPISFQDIITEFGTPKPISMDQLYRNGNYVTPNNTNIPTSGTISLEKFRGAVGSFKCDVTYSTDTFNVSTATLLAATSWDGELPVSITITIDRDVVVSSNNTSIAAVTIDPLPSGSIVTIINNGYIVGMGGAGGNGINSGTRQGGRGGTSIKIMEGGGGEVVIDNLGTIAGGGGGGGSALVAAGGGGRSGRINSKGGVSGTVSGGEGTFTSGGAGASPNTNVGAGDGGDWGANGGNGWGSSSATGGLGGYAVVGSLDITWISRGTIMGDITGVIIEV